MFITTLKKKYITLIVIISILTGVNTTLAAYQTDVISSIREVLIAPNGRKTNYVPMSYILLPMDVWTGFSTLFYFLNLQITGR